MKTVLAVGRIRKRESSQIITYQSKFVVPPGSIHTVVGGTRVGEPVNPVSDRDRHGRRYGSL